MSTIGEDDRLTGVRAAQPDYLPSMPDGSPGLLLARLGHGAMQLYVESLAETGLKPPHIAALFALRAQPIGQQALGEALDFDPVRLVGILNDLETAGLAERRRDCVDRRRHIVAITAAGCARLARVEQLSTIADERLLAGLDPAQRSALATLLKLISETSRLGESCPGTAAAAAELS